MFVILFGRSKMGLRAFGDRFGPLEQISHEQSPKIAQTTSSLNPCMVYMCTHVGSLLTPISDDQQQALHQSGLIQSDNCFIWQSAFFRMSESGIIASYRPTLQIFINSELVLTQTLVPSGPIGCPITCLSLVYKMFSQLGIILPFGCSTSHYL